MRVFAAIFLLVLQQVSSLPTRTPRPYTVPTPQIEVLGPMGLRVSIPDTPGLQFFGFQASINRPLNDATSWQVFNGVMDHNNSNTWSCLDGRLKLKVGDTIYYRLFVVKDELGYLLDDGIFEVKDITPGGPHDDPEESRCPSSDSHATADTGRPKEHVPRCPSSEVLVNLTTTMEDLLQQIGSLKDTNDILRDLVLKHPETATTLTLDGIIPRQTDPTLVAFEIIRQKLELQIKPKNAVRMKNGRIKFQVDSLDDKVLVVRAAKDKLKNSRINILY